MWLIGLLAGAAVYTLAGFLIAPRAIKLWMESANLSGPECRLRVQAVYVNPFTFFLSLRNVTLFEVENNMLVDVAGADMRVPPLGWFRTGEPGPDIAVRNLMITGTGGDGTILAVPEASVRNVRIDAGGGFLDIAYARLERPVARINRDIAGTDDRGTWLSVPWRERPGACISVQGFEAVAGRLRVTDDSITPPLELQFGDVMTELRRKPGQRTASTEIDVEGRIAAVGNISVTVHLRSPPGIHPDAFFMNVRNVDLPPLSPYFRRAFGRDITAGSVTGTVRHERDGAIVHVDNHLTFAGLKLSGREAQAVDDTLPLELALALATNAADRIDLAIADSVNEPPVRSVASMFVDNLRKHIEELAARPFEVLAGLTGNTDAVLDEITFLPGSAEIAPASTDTLALLAHALDQRPLLGVLVRPAYDPVADRNAIGAQQVRLHISLATSAPERANETAPDFDDPRVRDVLDEFAGSRLSEAQRRAIAREDDDTIRYRSIYSALVANERVSETVLRRLARFRARSFIDTLARDGIDRNRFRIAAELDNVSTDSEVVPLQLEVEARNR